MRSVFFSFLLCFILVPFSNAYQSSYTAPGYDYFDQVDMTFDVEKIMNFFKDEKNPLFLKLDNTWEKINNLQEILTYRFRVADSLTTLNFFMYYAAQLGKNRLTGKELIRMVEKLEKAYEVYMDPIVFEVLRQVKHIDLGKDSKQRSVLTISTRKRSGISVDATNVESLTSASSLGLEIYSFNVKNSAKIILEKIDTTVKKDSLYYYLTGLYRRYGNNGSRDNYYYALQSAGKFNQITPNLKIDLDAYLNETEIPPLKVIIRGIYAKIKLPTVAGLSLGKTKIVLENVVTLPGFSYNSSLVVGGDVDGGVPGFFSIITPQVKTDLLF